MILAFLNEKVGHISKNIDLGLLYKAIYPLGVSENQTKSRNKINLDLNAAAPRPAPGEAS